MNEKVKILGISFFNGTVNDVIDKLKAGGFMVVPSGPGLATVETETDYYLSLLEADIAIADSGYMVLIWNLFSRRKVNRISGLKFLNFFFVDPDIKSTDSLFLINPSLKEAEANVKYLGEKGFRVREKFCYQAPLYGAHVVDPILLSELEREKPKFIIINIGGGVQERLGAYLKRNLTYKPAIICTGAAIAFLTGHQAYIPNWGDRFYLGWLFRCIADPGRYIPRYWKAFKLLFIMMKYGENGPIATGRK